MSGGALLWMATSAMAIPPIGADELVDHMANSLTSTSEALQALVESGARPGLDHRFDHFRLGIRLKAARWRPVVPRAVSRCWQAV